MFNYEYLKDLDDETKDTINNNSFKLTTSNPLYDMPIDMHSISLDGSDFFHAVEAEKKSRRDNHLIYIRIIAKIDGIARGINVVIPYRDQAMLIKLTDLRYQIRNCDRVCVGFPELRIKSLINRKDLFLWSTDFKLKKTEGKTSHPFPSIDI